VVVLLASVAHLTESHQLTVAATCHAVTVIVLRVAVRAGATTAASTLALVTIVATAHAEAAMVVVGTTTAWISVVGLPAQAELVADGSILQAPWRGGLAAASVGGSFTTVTGGATFVVAAGNPKVTAAQPRIG